MLWNVACCTAVQVVVDLYVDTTRHVFYLGLWVRYCDLFCDWMQRYNKFTTIRHPDYIASICCAFVADLYVRYAIFTCAKKLTNSMQLRLPHGIKQKRVMKEIKTKNRDAQKVRTSHKVCVVSSEAGRESMVGRICERGRF